MVVASCFGPGVACAADVDFEFGPTLFQRPSVEKPATNETGFGVRMVIDNQRSYDSPLYQGMWPMTLEAFRGDRRMIRTNSVRAILTLPASNPRIYEPRRIIPPGVLITSNSADSARCFAERSYRYPLYEGLYPMTIESFKRSDWPVDEAVFTFNIAMNS
jgi:hypothetical protein